MWHKNRAKDEIARLIVRVKLQIWDRLPKTYRCRTFK